MITSLEEEGAGHLAGRLLVCPHFVVSSFLTLLTFWLQERAYYGTPWIFFLASVEGSLGFWYIVCCLFETMVFYAVCFIIPIDTSQYLPDNVLVSSNNKGYL